MRSPDSMCLAHAYRPSRHLALAMLTVTVTGVAWSCQESDGANPLEAMSESSQSMPFEVGVAKIDVTPATPIRLCGYGNPNRKNEAAVIAGPLFARALAIAESGGPPVVIVALDATGISMKHADEVAAQITQRFDIPRERITVCVTHSHTAPIIDGHVSNPNRDLEANGSDIERKHVALYTDRVTTAMVDVAARAIADVQPATLAWSIGQVNFAANRRKIVDGKWAGWGSDVDSGVDHDLPMLVARDGDGRIRAVLTSYACHCTTIGPLNVIHGDWAGQAALLLERRHEGATAIVLIGCGGDANPQPHGSIEYVFEHACEIADEVDRLVQSQPRAVQGPISCQLRRVPLPFEQTNTSNPPLPAVHYPIQAWTFDRDLAMVFLAGEVTADYSLRIKREAAAERLWINSYANGRPGYIISARQIAEGGYEAQRWRYYFNEPAMLEPGVEELLVGTVYDMLGDDFANIDERSTSDE